ncbi:MAG TPA: hypothetical protein VNO30_49305 [Kofleriaceae bacterium]|nr:hypothetical protein [Kofleriaceae bacterium]
MRSLKYGVLAAALLGLIGVFLPLSRDLSWWERREGPDGAGVFFVIGAFVLALVMGALSVAQGLQRWIALVALIGFAFVVAKFRLAFIELFTSQPGGQLIGVAAAAGLVCAALAAWRPEPAKAGPG